MVKFLFVWITIQLFIRNIFCIDWCHIENLYCNDKRHIACQTSYYQKVICTNGSFIHMREYQNLIIEQHNLYRNNFAEGKLMKFPPASQMRVMYWDKELAFLAEMHVHNCKFQHDECRATENYPNAGQNIAIYSSSKEIEYFDRTLMKTIELWFNEYKLTPVSLVDNITMTNLSKVGHFTVMMRENNVRVGCAAYKYNTKEREIVWFNYLITCNYADNNILGEKIYTRGNPCSECVNVGTVCSTVYKNLCE